RGALGRRPGHHPRRRVGRRLVPRLLRAAAQPRRAGRAHPLMRGLYCLLGDPVAHSRSPAIHARAFQLLAVDAVYAPCRVAVAELPVAVAGVRALGARGFNVTVPHKGELVRLVDQVSKDAERMGAVNCVSRAPDGQLLGHNTDAPGLLRALRVAPEGARSNLPEGARSNLPEGARSNLPEGARSN